MHTLCPGSSPPLLLSPIPLGSLFLTFIYSLTHSFIHSGMGEYVPHNVCLEVQEQLSEMSFLLMGTELSPSSSTAAPFLAGHPADFLLTH